MTTPAVPADLLVALRQVPGVLDASVDAAARVRLELVDGAGEPAVVEAVAEVARRFGGEVADASRIDEVGPISADGRLALESLALTAADGRVRADVLLGLDGRSAAGTGEGPDEPAAAQAVTAALLLALEELTEDAVIGTVEKAEITDGTAAVRLRLDVDGNEVLAEGAAPVRTHAPQALVRAVLAGLDPHLPV